MSIFRQILLYSWNPSLLLCMCVCELLSRVNVCCKKLKFYKKNHQYRLKHLQLTGVSSVFLLLEVDLNLQGQKCETVKARTKIHHMMHFDFDICDRTALLQMLYSMALTSNFQVKRLKR